MSKNCGLTTCVLTSAVGIVVRSSEAGASGVTGREVSEAVGAADRLNVVHIARAAKVAAGRQVDLERFVSVLAGKMKKIGFNFCF